VGEELLQVQAVTWELHVCVQGLSCSLCATRVLRDPAVLVLLGVVREQEVLLRAEIRDNNQNKS